MSYRADCAEIWEIVAEKRAAQADWNGMRTALQSREIILGTLKFLHTAPPRPIEYHRW